MKKILFLMVLMAASLQVQALIELNPNSKFIAAVVEIEEYETIEVWINTREHWNQRRSLTDSYSEQEYEEVDQITDWTNLCNLAESTYEPCRPGRSVKDIKTDLMKVGVMIDKEFQAWAEKEAQNL